LQARGAARLRSADIGAARRRLGPRFARARSRAMFPRFPAAAFHLPRLSFRRTRAVLSRSLRIDCIIAFFSLPVKPGTPLNRSGTRRARRLRRMGLSRMPAKSMAAAAAQTHSPHALAACDGIRPTARHIRGMGENALDSLTREKAFVRLRFLLCLQIQELIV